MKIITILLFQLLCFAKNKAIYINDSRLEASDHPDAKVRELSKSVAGIFFKSHLKKKEDSYELVWGIYGDGDNYCPDVPFQGQPSGSRCSAFLIADNLVMTAGHCMSTQYHCSSRVFVFDYLKENISGPHGPYQRNHIKTDALYNCKKILKSVNDKVSKLDYAIIELEKKVEDRSPLKLRQKGQIANDQSVFMIGTPDGLPLKVADQAKVVKNSHDMYFNANLDAFQRNSGSPVFNQDTYEVEGILVRGNKDYEQSAYCHELNFCNDSNCPGAEEATRVLKTNFLEYLK